MKYTPYGRQFLDESWRNSLRELDKCETFYSGDKLRVFVKIMMKLFINNMELLG